MQFVANVRLFSVLRGLSGLAASFCAVGCASSGGDTSTAGAAISEAAFTMEVGKENDVAARVLTIGHASVKNMFRLALLSDAAYYSGDELLLRLCDIGLHAKDSAPCATPNTVEAELATFDTAGDDHAIYVRAVVPTRTGPREVAVLAFRGTASRANMMTDAAGNKVEEWGSSGGHATPELLGKNLPGRSHEGFDRAAMRLWLGDTPDRSLRTFLFERHRFPDAPPLYLTGHSLGGAIATVLLGYMFYGECAAIAPDERFSTPREVPETELAWTLPESSCPATTRFGIEALYSYGSPRIGDPAFAESIANMMALRRVAHYRVVNGNDIVARVAPRRIGYSHIHLNIHGLTEIVNGEPRRYGIVEDEHADVVWGATEAGTPVLQKCRQWEDSLEQGIPGPSACPTNSLAYLMPPPRDAPPHFTDVLRLGAGAREPIDDTRTFFPSLADHSMTKYIPLLAIVGR